MRRAGVAVRCSLWMYLHPLTRFLCPRHPRTHCPAVRECLYVRVYGDCQRRQSVTWSAGGRGRGAAEGIDVSAPHNTFSVRPPPPNALPRASELSVWGVLVCNAALSGPVVWGARLCMSSPESRRDCGGQESRRDCARAGAGGWLCVA